jgi:uncharacterized protein (UPF0548 family)
MFFFCKPAPPVIRAFLEVQARLDLTYSAVGVTAAVSPAVYRLDHKRIRLGTGEPAFIAAKDALHKWEQFRLGWVEPCWPDTPIEPGQVVGVLARYCGLWSLNACRIVYVKDVPRRFGFAYGTLPDHIESGEERFTVEWQEDNDAVWYDILAFSRPNYFLARYPFVRRIQKRFAMDSAAAMLRAVG